MVVSMAGLWIAYLVPHRLRYRQQLLESRTDDRFSERLRVLRVAQVADQGPAVTGTRKGLVVRRATGRGQTQDESPGVGTARVQLHAPRATGPGASAAAGTGREARGGGSMDRPHGTRDRVAADAARRSAAEHSQRAAHLARRASAARRRALLTLVLVVAVATGWSVVGLAGASVLLGVVPTVALGAALTLGRRAVVSAGRADAAWAAGATTRVAVPASSRRTGAVGRAVRPSDATTEVMARIAAQGAGSAPATVPEPGAAPAAPEASQIQQTTVDDEAGSGTWAPVPVPRPAYTLKPSARRPEPAPLVLDPSDVPTAPAAAEEPAEPAEARTAATALGAGLDLDAILARRRASGE